jgi:hypothetical protein
MRFCLVIGALVLAAAGCENSSSAPRPGITLRPTLPPSGSAVPMFSLRVVLLKHRVRPDAPVEDIWRLLGTTALPYEKRAVWEANDLRLGDGAHLAADRLNELATESTDRSAHVNVLQVTENMDFAIAAGPERDVLDLVWTDAAGVLRGRHFTKAVAQFRLVCRSDPQEPEAVRLALAPEVLYGAEELRWVRTEAGIVQRMARSSLMLTDLAAEVRLGPGRILVIGGRRRSDLSVGGAFFHETRGPDSWAQTIVLTAERARPGEAPQGGKVHFIPAARSPAPSRPAVSPAAAPSAEKPASAPAKDISRKQG